MQIISLFHHLWFIRYKGFFRNTRERFKGLRAPGTKTELNARKINVTGNAVVIFGTVSYFR